MSPTDDNAEVITNFQEDLSDDEANTCYEENDCGKLYLYRLTVPSLGLIVPSSDKFYRKDKDTRM